MQEKLICSCTIAVLILSSSPFAQSRMKKPIIKAEAKEEGDEHQKKKKNNYDFAEMRARRSRKSLGEISKAQETEEERQPAIYSPLHQSSLTAFMFSLLSCSITHTHIWCINIYTHSWAAVRRSLIASPIAGPEGQGHIHLEYHKQT